MEFLYAWRFCGWRLGANVVWITDPLKLGLRRRRAGKTEIQQCGTWIVALAVGRQFEGGRTVDFAFARGNITFKFDVARSARREARASATAGAVRDAGDRRAIASGWDESLRAFHEGHAFVLAIGYVNFAAR